MTNQTFRDEFFTFSKVASKLSKLGFDSNTTSIRNDFKSGVIETFLFDNMGIETNPQTINRIKYLKSELNEYAREHIRIRESPAKIIFKYIPKLPPVSQSELDALLSSSNPDDIFELWLRAYDININMIKLGMSRVEFDNYLKYHNEFRATNSGQTVYAGDFNDREHNKLSPAKDTESELGTKRKYNLPDRNDGATIPPRNKAVLTLIIEHVLLSKHNGAEVDLDSWDSIGKFLQKQLNDGAILNNGEKLNRHLEGISIKSGTSKGVDMKDKIPNRKYGQPQKTFTVAYFRQQFKRIREEMNYPAACSGGICNLVDACIPQEAGNLTLRD